MYAVQLFCSTIYPCYRESERVRECMIVANLVDDVCLTGFGAAMVIESLGLYYHVQCFRCCVCHTPLGNGSEGADVRVRVDKLHCRNCYSNDEGTIVEYLGVFWHGALRGWSHLQRELIPHYAKVFKRRYTNVMEWCGFYEHGIFWPIKIFFSIT